MLIELLPLLLGICAAAILTLAAVLTGKRKQKRLLTAVLPGNRKTETGMELQDYNGLQKTDELTDQRRETDGFFFNKETDIVIVHSEEQI